MISIENSYKILEVRKDFSQAELKKAFRKKAKLFHPDKSGKKNTEQFQKILEAYNLLCSLHENSVFDFRERKQESTFDYHEWLSKKDDNASRAKLIFWDVMHNFEDEAVSIFKQFFDAETLQKYFSIEDFMDYGYILSEELFFRSEYYDAFLLLEQIIKLEYKYNYFKIFFPEVIDFALKILKNKMEGNVPDELALDSWERSLDLNFSPKDERTILNKMGKAYERLGDFEMAKACYSMKEKL